MVELSEFAQMREAEEFGEVLFFVLLDYQHFIS